MSTAISFSRSESVVIHHQWRSTMASDWTDAVVVTRTRHKGLSLFCRKHGDFSERLGDRRWFTVARAKELQTAAALKNALNDAEGILDISLDWQQLIPKLAALDWVAAAGLAPFVGVEMPDLPEAIVLQRQGAIQRSDTVKLSVEWAYEVHSLQMPLKRWFRLCAGKVSRARSRGHYEGTSFWNYWTFDLGQKNSLTVAYGENGGVGYEGSIEDAFLDGPKPKGIDVARLLLIQTLQRRRASVTKAVT